ncbi:hypothetical protein, partial [Acinetobacter baumannii]
MTDLVKEEILLILREIQKIPTIRPADGMGGVRVTLPSPAKGQYWETQILIKIYLMIKFFTNFSESLDEETMLLTVKNLRIAHFL